MSSSKDSIENQFDIISVSKEESSIGSAQDEQYCDLLKMAEVACNKSIFPGYFPNSEACKECPPFGPGIKAELSLMSGENFSGYSFGAPVSVAGEVVFNTGMVGYPESLTDPSYTGQVLVITYPLIGNYGVPDVNDTDKLGLPRFFEGKKIHVRGVIIAEYSFDTSHYLATQSLGEWLKSEGVPGIFGVDTREITKILRMKGSILGKIQMAKQPEIEFDDPNLLNLPATVSVKEKVTYCPSVMGCEPVCHVYAIDFGIKFNIIRYFVHHMGVKLTVCPWNYDYSKDEFDGLFLSNGPGDPALVTDAIEILKKFMDVKPNCPIFGICLGNQILALAAGASTHKMKFGNRGMNQPCVDLRTMRCYITPQNHGYVVDNETLPEFWAPFFVNANDDTNEGLIHKTKPWFSVQFHPEACGGPTDTAFLFDYFLQAIRNPGQIPVTTIKYNSPKTYKKVLVLGSGGLSIGQAGEFDYSGSQCIKALKEANVQTVLINPNIATVQTSAGLADQVYFLPVTPEFVERVIQKEKPDGIFCTFGGQTALNCAVTMYEAGIFEKYNVKVLGTPISAIIMTEDREKFAAAVDYVGYKVAESKCCNTTEEAVEAATEIGYPVLVRAAFALGGLGSGFCDNEEELRALTKVSFANSPQVIVDKSLKGWKELEYEVVRDSLDNCITVCNMENFDPMGIHTGDSIVVAPSQTLTNAEYFRLRNCAIKMIRHLGVVGECNIQYAVDPKSSEFRIIEVNARLSRSSALASKATGYPLAYVAAKLGLGHNLVQLRNQVTKSTTACFEPSLDYCVVKFPKWDLKKFVTVNKEIGSCMKSVGEIMAIGRSFEETIQKALRMVDESCNGFEGSRFDVEAEGPEATKAEVELELTKPTPMRMFAIAKAFEHGYKVEEIHQMTKIDRWFLNKLQKVFSIGIMLKNTLSFEELVQTPNLLLCAKKNGYSDKQIAKLVSLRVVRERTPSTSPYVGDEVDPAEERTRVKQRALVQHHSVPEVVTEQDVRGARQELGIRPAIKQVDTVAGEFPAETNYLYLTYNGNEDDVEPGVVHNLYNSNNRVSSPRTRVSSPKFQMEKKTGGAYSYDFDGDHSYHEQSFKEDKRSSVIVLGCGCYRIGSSVEFDWCSVQAIKTIHAAGRPAIVINCNPETVSTDYDESDRLYFEELSHETVLEIYDFENPYGVILSVGGQMPNNLAIGLARAGVRTLGTSVSSIDMAENRFKFSKMCDELKIDQPEWSEFSTFKEAVDFCRRVQFPCLVRPSYVLSGAAMRVVDDEASLGGFLETAAIVSRDHPVVISKYLINAKEVEFDAIACQGQVVNYAISEHVENAGVHSGDATLLLPAQKLYVETHRKVKHMSIKLAKALNISGPFNIQFMCRDNEVKVIECNLRASRTFPFISKTFALNFIEVATKIMLGQMVRSEKIQPIDTGFVGCKVPVFSFSRLKNSDPRLGVEMQSTGEVACYGMTKYDAYLKALVSSGFKLPAKNILISIGQLADKHEIAPVVNLLTEMGYQLYCTKGTFETFKTEAQLRGEIFNAIQVHKPHVKKQPNITDLITQGRIDLVINVADSRDSQGVTDGFRIRRMAVDNAVPLLNDVKNARLFIESLHRKWSREKTGRDFWGIEPYKYYHNLG